MKKAIIGSMILLVCVNLVPYACRFWQGYGGAPGSLPDADHPAFSLWLSAGFASLPAVPLVAAFLLRRRIPVAFITAVVVAVALLTFWHCRYGIAADPQASVGRVIIPMYAALTTGAIAAMAGAAEVLIRAQAIRRGKVGAPSEGDRCA